MRLFHGSLEKFRLEEHSGRRLYRSSPATYSICDKDLYIYIYMQFLEGSSERMFQKQQKI